MSDQLGRVRVDPATRRFGQGGRQVLGGSPRRLFRLTDVGAALLDQLGAGRRLAATQGRTELVGRLVDAGVLHPDPPVGAGPFGAADVTLVVPVRDRATGVEGLLASVARAGPMPARVVVVDDGSQDPAALVRAVERVRHAWDGVPIEIVRRPAAGGPAAARTEGLGRVVTPLVAFVDSDCAVTDAWLGLLVAAFEDPRVALVAPRVRSASIPGNPMAAYEQLRSPLDMGRHRATVAPGTATSYVPSAALVARTDVLAELGGFDPALTVGEDVDLVWRAVAAGWQVRYVPEAVVHHEPRPDLRAWLEQRYGYGRSAAALDRRHPGSVAPVVLSPWSAAVWGLALVGSPLAGGALAAMTTGRLVRSLPDLPRAASVAMGLGGHLAAGRQLARATVRAWWPAAVVASLCSRRARRRVAVAAAVSVGAAWREATDRGVPQLGLATFAGLALLDDAAYGAGVWAGCWQQRSIRALLPSGPTSTGAGAEGRTTN